MPEFPDDLTDIEVDSLKIAIDVFHEATHNYLGAVGTVLEKQTTHAQDVKQVGELAENMGNAMTSLAGELLGPQETNPANPVGKIVLALVSNEKAHVRVLRSHLRGISAKRQDVFAAQLELVAGIFEGRNLGKREAYICAARYVVMRNALSWMRVLSSTQDVETD